MKRVLFSVVITLSLFLSAGCSGSDNSAPAQESSAPVTESAAPEAAVSSIDEEQAKAIALNDAGITETDVTFMQVKTDIENGVSVFDVEFIAGDTEYDYEIDAATGELRSKDRDIEAAPAEHALPTGDEFSKEDALGFALEHAGLKESDVTVTELYRETEDGIDVYKVEFQSGDMEYDYEIRVSDGKILESESEPIND
jgi:uncharacterized membrane protein YkoI